MEFLPNREFRPIIIGGIPGGRSLELALGQGQASLEIVAIECATQPPIPVIRTTWKEKQGGRSSPVLLVVIAQRLGHAKPSFTSDIYARLMPGIQEQAAVKFDQQLIQSAPALIPKG